MRPLQDWSHFLFKDNTPPEKVLFRVDAGRVYGLSFGHVFRCIVLANYLNKEYGAESLFLMRNYQDGINHVAKNGFRVRKMPVEINAKDEKKEVVEAVEEFQPDIFLIDLPYNDTDTSYYGALKKQGIHIVFIDDSRFILPEVDVLLNSSILAPHKMKKVVNNNRTETSLLLGMDYFIFDDSLIGETRKSINGACNILISLGGSDPTSTTVKILHALREESFPEYFFTIILGPANKDFQEIKELTKPDNYQVAINPDNLIPFMQSCDIAVCGGGRTMYELCYLGKTFLPVATARHEEQAIEEFTLQGKVKFGMTSWDPAFFRKNLTDLVISSKQLA